MLKVGSIMRFWGTRQTLTQEKVDKFLNGIKYAIAWFALTSLIRCWYAR